MVECPLCSAALDAEEDELEVGDFLICEECGASLEVVSLDPLEIEESEEEFDDLEEGFSEDDPWTRADKY